MHYIFVLIAYDWIGNLRLDVCLCFNHCLHLKISQLLDIDMCGQLPFVPKPYARIVNFFSCTMLHSIQFLNPYVHVINVVYNIINIGLVLLFLC